MGSLTKGMIGKQDLEIQFNTNATETFERIASTGSTLELSKFPDIWGGTGKISVASEVATAATITTATITTATVTTATITNATITNLTLVNAPATDPGDIAETVALGTLTHDILKTKINDLLAALRVANII